ncbi:efflux transporter outer membrane subunit [Paludibacterium paludis]|uniref:RND transporter n=1 Tax=Paludibacterium paludis TaxID=1225769 RepID=A0A918P1W9_9NEIS|nr:efflux transporter outer membrane subunit [Paludibacterium paludis]GGY14727.1 RND transporter [Paludibacterium paludis]
MNRPVTLALCLGLAACAQNTPPRPAPALPAQFSAPLPGNAPMGSQAWAMFGDRGLNEWIARVWAGNTDLAVSLARQDAAAAELGVSEAERYPTVGFQQSMERRKLSRYDLGELSEDTPNPSRRYASQFNLSYELDLRGKVSAVVRAGKANYQATRFDESALRLSLARQTAELWMTRAELIASESRLRHAADLRQRVWQSAQARQKAGLTSGNKIRDQEREAAESALQVTQHTDSLKKVERSLCLLAAQMPDECRLPPALPVDQLTLPEIGSELPAQLLQRRPDLAAAEARYNAARARADEAEAARWPALNLIGNVGINAGSWAGLRKSHVLAWSLMPQIAVSLFDGGRLRQEAERSRSATREQYAAWHGAITQAVYEVEDGLAAIMQTQTQYDTRQRQSDLARRQLAAAQNSRQAGLLQGSGEWTVQLTQLQAEQDALLSRKEHLQAAVRLIAALGGGWDPQQPDPKK